MRVGELGFGTGLNFAVAAELCLQAHQRLHFVSFETAPLAPSVFRSLARRRASQQGIYRELAARYPPLIPGWHRRCLAAGRITLSLYWGDAAAGLAEITATQKRPFDLWLLDGFAPAKNPQMWTQSLFSAIAQLACKGTQITTFTAAGRVRRGLSAVGFEMRRVDQRPHKRESLAGHFVDQGMAPWTPPVRVNVIGAGIAGASLARHLAETGMAVKVFERCSAVAMGASAIPTTVLHGRLLADNSSQAKLRSHSYLYSADYCATFSNQGDRPVLPTPVVPTGSPVVPTGSPVLQTGIQRTGALQIPSANASAERLVQLADSYAASGDWLELLSAAEASARVGTTIDGSALWFPHACTINTPQLCRLLLQHANIELVRATAITGWFEEAATVLAIGVACQAFAGLQYLEVAAVAGQIDIVRPVAARLSGISAPIIGSGYMAPQGGKLSVGASYEYSEWEAANATRANLQHLDAADYEWESRHRGVRSVASDRTAIAGQLTDLAANPQINRYVSTGHGSMGTVSSHYCALLLSAQLNGEFAPMTTDIQDALAPQRFRHRQARRGYKFGSSA
jgi:tRNA 5-methylaminomethyl-2-thiouridine biosynthesis bifunctional protein